jgi:hypothetical protein
MASTASATVASTTCTGSMPGGLHLSCPTTSLGKDLLPNGEMKVLLHSGGCQGPSTMMNHAVGVQTPTIPATSFTPSLGEYVLFRSFSIVYCHDSFLCMHCSSFNLQFENPKKIYIYVAAFSFVLTKNPKNQKDFCFSKTMKR